VRLCLQRLVDDRPEFTVVQTCEDEADVLQLCRNLEPDLIVADIGSNDLEKVRIVELFQGDAQPDVIVLSDDGREAARAFDLGVGDFVIKPVRPKRFACALERMQTKYRRRQRMNEHTNGSPNNALFDATNRIALKQGTGYVLLNLDQIDWVQAADTYVRFHTGGKSYMIRERLKHVEQRLAAKGFLRIHRSTIINLDRVREVLTESNGGAYVVLETGTKLKISRSYLKDLETHLPPLQLG
jgi:two-component system LytT family response regulator